LIATLLVVLALSWNRPWFDDDVASMNPLPAALKDEQSEKMVNHRL